MGDARSTVGFVTPSRWVHVTRRWRRWSARRCDGMSLANATRLQAHRFARQERRRGYHVIVERG